ncbi:MAG: heme ABC transporter permease [Aliidongia sp.]|jgi:heme exporter protein C
MHRFANPARFMRVSGVVLPWLTGATIVLLAIGLFLGFRAPADYQQGETVKIMFIHVPAAMMAMFGYSSLAVASAMALIWRHPLAEIAAQETAPLGAAFTAICLVTGSLWGEPMWGTWWVWDARLTSVLVLFFLYLGYIALVHAFDDPTRGSRASSVLALVGAVNVPIIHWSVVWWNSLHQGSSVLSMDGLKMGWSIRIPVLTMALAFTLLFTLLLVIRMRAALLERKIRALRVLETEAVPNDYSFVAPEASA